MRFRSLPAVLSLLAVTACGGYTPTGEPTKVPVTRVFMHEPGRFSALVVANPSSGELQLQTFQRYGTCRIIREDVRFFRDVPPDTAAWILVRNGRYGPGGADCREVVELLEIHLRSGEDLNGAGWDHGKSGRGTTEALQ